MLQAVRAAPLLERLLWPSLSRGCQRAGHARRPGRWAVAPVRPQEAARAVRQGSHRADPVPGRPAPRLAFRRGRPRGAFPVPCRTSQAPPSRPRRSRERRLVVVREPWRGRRALADDGRGTHRRPCPRASATRSGACPTPSTRSAGTSGTGGGSTVGRPPRGRRSVPVAASRPCAGSTANGTPPRGVTSGPSTS